MINHLLLTALTKVNGQSMSTKRAWGYCCMSWDLNTAS